MSTYRLDETPDTYISALIEEGPYSFQMYKITGESNFRNLPDIDLRKDKLIIYGTQINDSVREKLHTSLILKSNKGKIYVDCNGSCYIYVTGTNAFYRPIQQLIFDWFSFGVVVPNSVYHVLRKQRDEELATLSSRLRCAKDDWEATKKEMDKVNLQLSGCRKEQLDKESKLESTKIKLEKVENELSSTNLELQLSMIRLDCSNKKVIELEEQVKSGEKIQDQLSLIANDVKSIRVLL